MFSDRLQEALDTCTRDCEDDGPSCAIAAYLLMNSAGNEKEDTPAALRLYERACRSNQDAVACFIWGEELDRGAHVQHDAAAARKAWDLGCKQGNDNSCAALKNSRIEVERSVIYERK
jgi:TPR repeat protein